MIIRGGQSELLAQSERQDASIGVRRAQGSPSPRDHSMNNSSTLWRLFGLELEDADAVGEAPSTRRS